MEKHKAAPIANYLDVEFQTDSDLELVCELHAKTRDLLKQAISEYKQQEFELFQHSLIMALRLILELKNAIQCDQGQLAVELFMGYQFLFAQLSNQLDVCDLQQLSEAAEDFALLSDSWHTYRQNVS